MSGPSPDSSLFPSTFTPFQVTINDPVAGPLKFSGLQTAAPASHPAAPPLLLVHGFPQTHLIWHKTAPALAAHFRLVLIDLRGYGASDKPTAVSASGTPDPEKSRQLYTKRAMAGDCVAVMHELLGAGTRFHVLAHDRGARVAHYLAAHHADSVLSAMFLDICPTKAMYARGTKEFAAAYWHWFFLVQPPPFPENVIITAPDAFAGKMLRGLPGASGAGKGEVFAPAAWEVYAAQLKDWSSVSAMCNDYRAALVEDIKQQQEDEEAGRKIGVPVKVIWGKQGVCEKMFDPVAEWERVSEAGMVDKGSKALDCGHYVPEERPEELIQECLEFFKR